jgi:hypothetical protein
MDQKPQFGGGSMSLLHCNAMAVQTGNAGKPDLPRANIGEPQSAEGAARNTPPKSFRKVLHDEHGKRPYG